MSKLPYYTLWFILKIVFSSSQICEHVNDFEFKYKDHEWNQIRLTGCISDKSFYPKIVVDIYSSCGTNSIIKLEKGFINNMRNLKIITIGKCHVETIEPGAFHNLPKIEKIDIYENSFKTVSSGVFNNIPTLRHLYLANNKISHIEDNAFANLPSLREIFLEKNKLDYIRREWFTNTDNIVHFSVYHNSVRKIPTGMFHNWKKLKFLNLNSNAISAVEGVIFKNNPPLIRNLDLHHNRLTSLHPDMLPDSVFIEHFSVSANLLNFIPDEILEKLRAANMVIFGNPFSCPCLDRINKILLDRDVTVDNTFFAYVSTCKDRDVPICGLSSNFSKTCINSVDEKLTNRMIVQMKQSGYNAVYDKYGQQCAMFDDVD